MTKEQHPDVKVMIIGGGTANITDVAATFGGIVQALKEYKVPITEHNITIYVRRGGPNYQEGLRVMRETGQDLLIPIHVYGPEIHMAAVAAYALKYKSSPAPAQPTFSAANFCFSVELINPNLRQLSKMVVGNCKSPMRSAD